MLPTFELLLGVCGLRPPRSSVTRLELQLLLQFARGAGTVIEVGVFEGSTSLALGTALAEGGTIVLVDPFFRELRIEQWFGFSGSRRIARRTTRSLGKRRLWIETTSEAAAAERVGAAPAALIFLDARHDYASVLADLQAWAGHVGEGGVLAIHDCRPCLSRPELRAGEGSCRAVEEFLAAGGWSLAAEADSLAVLKRSGRGDRSRGT